MRNITEQGWLSALRKAAKAGRKAILDNYDEGSRSRVVKRGVGGDLTLRIDEVSEKAIHRSLLRDLGENSFVFVSEELGEIRAKDNQPGPVVICDPLDGSHNAQVGIPLFSLSLAVLGAKRKMRTSDKRHFGDVDVALIQSIMTNDEYTAVKGRGSYHNGELMKKKSQERVPQIKTLGIECGDIDYLKKLISKLTKKKVYKFRVLGSAAISLSLLAEGTLDALVFAQPGGARTIDSPAGYLVAKEAGCAFSDLGNSRRNMDKVEVGFHSRINLIGTKSKQVHKDLVRLVREP
ncbi:MAG: inositol monophosphatase family protein [Nitrososphaerales archaeon]